MELILFIDTQKYKDFIYWIGKHIKRNWRRYIKSQKLININEYLNSDKCNIQWLLKKRRPINIIRLINICIYNLEYTFYTDKVIIHFNKVNYLPFTFNKIYDIAKLINFGNLEVKGDNLFTRMFNDYKNNIVTLYKIYLKERHICH